MSEPDELTKRIDSRLVPLAMRVAALERTVTHLMEMQDGNQEIQAGLAKTIDKLLDKLGVPS